MNEIRTTGLFVALAGLSLGMAWVFRPTVVRSEGEIAAEKRGSIIFPDLNPDDARSFRLTRYDESMATVSRIELAKNSGDLWTLPSADGYPADSAEQVSQAMTPLVDLRVLSTVSTDRGDHALYGVVEPNEQELTVSASGVGVLVQVGGAENEILASLIIGKKVEGTENQHFVRVPTEDAIYEVEIATEALSTDLEKWIKGDILNVRSFDIEHVGLRDYAILRTERGYGLGRNFDADVQFKDNKWILENFVDHSVEGSPVSHEPPDGMQLDDKPLTELRNNIQNLKIVNVRRKPPGLAADLKADKSLLENQDSTSNLQRQGFFPMESGEVFAAGGELIVGTKEGINYLLRFGNTSISQAGLESETETENEEGEEGSLGVNRYLLVTAQLDESKYPAPELKIVPESVEEMLALEEQQKSAESAPVQDDQPVDSADPPPESDGETPSTDAPSTETPAEESPGEEVTTETTDEAAAESSAENPVETDEPASGEIPQDSDAPIDGESAPDSPEAAADETTAGRLPNSTAIVSSSANSARVRRSAADGRPMPGMLVSVPSTPQEEPVQESANEGSPEIPSDDPPTAAESSENADTQLEPSSEETPEELQERLEYLQETLRKENQRLIDDRNEKLAEARKKVAELNARFADWYYMVSDSVYNKMKIPRSALFKSPSANDDEASNAAGPLQLPDLPPGIQLPAE